MIVKMLKTFVVARNADRGKLLESLRELGVIHVQPVDPATAVAEEQAVARVETLSRAVQLLSTTDPQPGRLDLPPAEAADAALEIQRATAERNNRLTSLYRKIEELSLWGDVRLEQLAELKQAGLDVHFVLADEEAIGRIDADCVQRLNQQADDRWLAAVVSTGQPAQLPEEADIVPPPDRDRPTLRAEAAEIDQALKADAKRLGQLVHQLPELRQELARMKDRAEYTRTERSALDDENLFAIQGWVPADQAEALVDRLADRGVDAAVSTSQPTEVEQPPTLVRYPWWANPIKALFGILGTTPGYREYDLAPFFMIAMPIFTAMLVGDAGYGLVFTLVGTAMYGRLARAGKTAAAQMILVFAIATTIWGALTGNWFGVAPAGMVSAGGIWAALGSILSVPAVLYRSDDEAARNIVMRISFVIGCVHLMLAHLRQAIGLLPDQRGVAEIGWMGFIFGMFTLVWLMFFEPLFPAMVTLWILVISWAVIVLFCHPSRNPLKRVVIGVVGNLMSIPGAFGDMLSYIRLMAVGLASFYIANSFNSLGADLASLSPWAVPAAAVIILLAHLLNIGLCLVAVFAHGVRLNMLEFSTNAGVQWDGYPFAPFTSKANLEGDR
jgi:V/A-type H+-transporting ATPase subunit I